MRAAKKVLVGYGESQRYQRKMIRILFEDYSDNPYVVDLSREQCDVVLKADRENHLELAVYVPTGLSFTKNCAWSRVSLIDDWFG